jgi:hypothetical protein
MYLTIYALLSGYHFTALFHHNNSMFCLGYGTPVTFY